MQFREQANYGVLEKQLFGEKLFKHSTRRAWCQGHARDPLLIHVHTSAWEQPSIPCAVARTNFLERSTPEINAFSDRMERAEDFLFTSWVFTPETQPQSGQEKSQVPFLNQGFVILAAPAMAWEQDTSHIQGSNSQTDVTPSKRAAKIPWPSRLLLLTGQCFQLLSYWVNNGLLPEILLPCETILPP